MDTRRARFSLPENCWRAVFQYLPFDDLLSLSTTCKVLRVLTEPCLYRETSWNWSASTSLRRLLCLFQIILKRPYLAASVRHLSLLSASATPWTEPERDINWGQLSPGFRNVTTRWADPMYGILHRFTRLKTVEVPITALLGFGPEYTYNLKDSILPDTL